MNSYRHVLCSLPEWMLLVYNLYELELGFAFRHMLLCNKHAPLLDECEFWRLQIITTQQRREPEMTQHITFIIHRDK